MEESILKSVKKVMGIGVEYTAFDTEIILYINSIFSTLNQLGLGPDDGFQIEDDTAKWSNYTSDLSQLNMIKAYIPTKTRLAFDPPATSFGLDAIKAQIAEYEWRLNFGREVALTEEDS